MKLQIIKFPYNDEDEFSKLKNSWLYIVINLSEPRISYEKRKTGKFLLEFNDLLEYKYNTNIYDLKNIIAYAIYNPKSKHVESVEVDKFFQRRGVATYLYNYIEQDQNIKLTPSSSISEKAKMFWKDRLIK